MGDVDIDIWRGRVLFLWVMVVTLVAGSILVGVGVGMGVGMGVRVGVRVGVRAGVRAGVVIMAVGLLPSRVCKGRDLNAVE